MATHYDIVHLTSVGSTQDEAARISSASDRPTLVVAGRQVAGRGRSGRVWVEPDRALFASLSFRSAWPSSALPRIPLCAGTAMRSSIDEECGVVVDLKWPNDLLLPLGKVGGVLVEASGDRVTVGCGLNLWWAEPVPGAASLFNSDVDDGLPEAIAKRWADELLSVLERGPDRWPRADYLAACVTIGRDVAWDGGEGKAIDVDDDGGLVVRTRDGVTTVVAGDVHLLGHN